MGIHQWAIAGISVLYRASRPRNRLRSWAAARGHAALFAACGWR